MTPFTTATFAACATAVGGTAALLRISGTGTREVVARAGLQLGAPWTVRPQTWALAGGACPCRTLLAPARRSFTGEDLVEVTLPGSPALVAIAVEALVAAGAEPAPPGGFTRQALANGRISLDQAEAIHALATVASADAARRALARLGGALARELGPVRERLIGLRAQVESGLDFLDEDDVHAHDAVALRDELIALRASVRRWLAATASVGDEPVVALVGPANAGKSALFVRLTGAPALISPIAGTTRDALEATWIVDGRRVRLLDTAGWLADAGSIDAEAVARGRDCIESACLVLACSAPDAPLPRAHGLPSARTLVVATKSDLARAIGAGAEVACSTASGDGLAELSALVARRLAAIADGEPRQERLLREAALILDDLIERPRAEALLADDLRRVADALGELIGATTPDDVLAAIFARFCIGK